MWQYYRDDPNNNVTESESFKYKNNITGKDPTPGNKKDVNIVVPLKNLSNFRGTLEMPLINCQINFILTWFEDCVISSAYGDTKFEITDTNLYGLVVTLSTQGNTKMLEQLKSVFKRTIHWKNVNQNFQQQDKINI